MPAGPEQRRRTAASQSALLDAATERIVTHAIDAIASQITPSVLARSTEIVSADTAYRMLESAEHTLQMLTNRSFTPGFSSEELRWPMSSGTVGDAVDIVSRTGSVDGVRIALRQLLLRDFDHPELALARIIDAATMTASRAWTGDLHIREDRMALARQIRAVRLQAARAHDEELDLFLRVTLAQLRRRPRSGVTITQIVILLRGLAEGMIDRLLLDPEVGAIDDVVDAMIELAISLTEEGFLLGGTIPAEPEARRRFDALLEVAEAHWRAGHMIDSLEMLAAETSLTPVAVAELFPTVADVADALLRTVVVGDQIAGSRETRLSLLAVSLQRLAQAADELPIVVELDRTLASGHSVLSELRDVAAELAHAGLDRSVRADRFGEQLVVSACAGMQHWETTRMLIDLVRRRRRTG